MLTTGSDRVKRKYKQMRGGDVQTESYHVKRPMISAEYQDKMGAIDNHNWRRQSGKGTEALERVCVTNSSKDRIFINVVWVYVRNKLQVATYKGGLSN